MKIIKVLTDPLLNQEIPTTIKHARWAARIAARAVMFDERNRIALMHINRFQVYKLPGGGSLNGEQINATLKREVTEETGYRLNNPSPIGITIEKRNRWKLLQISFCFFAKTRLYTGSQLTDEEKQQEFSLHWAATIDDAIELIASNSSPRYDDQFITVRDRAILSHARTLL